MARTLWLIGMMGSGKTSVAPHVAAMLGRDWVDTDDAVSRRTGRSVSELLARSESSFRAMEADVIVDLAGSELVVACGGGVVLSATNREVMAGTGYTVWLRADPETLAARVGIGEGRPLLGPDPRADLEWIGTVRTPLYRAAADAAVDVDGRSVEEVTAEVVSAWNASSEE